MFFFLKNVEKRRRQWYSHRHNSRSQSLAPTGCSEEVPLNGNGNRSEIEIGTDWTNQMGSKCTAPLFLTLSCPRL